LKGDLKNIRPSKDDCPFSRQRTATGVRPFVLALRSNAEMKGLTTIFSVTIHHSPFTIHQLAIHLFTIYHSPIPAHAKR